MRARNVLSKPNQNGKPESPACELKSPACELNERTDDIAATAGELHQLLQGITPEGKAYLRTPGLTPKAPYEIRVLRLVYQAFCDGKLTAEQGMHFVGRLCDADYGRGTNSCRSQVEIAAQRRCSVDTIQRADLALRKVGLATRKRARRSAAIFTIITPDELDQLFVQVGGELQKDAATCSNEPLQDDQEAAPTMRLQEDLRDRTSFAASKIKKPQNGALRSRTSSAALPYRDLKKKDAQARETLSVIGHALESWMFRGGRGWCDGFRSAFGEPPDCRSCRLYEQSEALLQKELAGAKARLEASGKFNGDVRDRYQLALRRMSETAERRLSGAKAFSPSLPGDRPSEPEGSNGAPLDRREGLM